MDMEDLWIAVVILLVFLVIGTGTGLLMNLPSIMSNLRNAKWLEEEYDEDEDEEDLPYEKN